MTTWQTPVNKYCQQQKTPEKKEEKFPQKIYQENKFDDNNNYWDNPAK